MLKIRFGQEVRLPGIKTGTREGRLNFLPVGLLQLPGPLVQNRNGNDENEADHDPGNEFCHADTRTFRRLTCH